MSLNNISLPPQLIADLYHHALVQDTARAMPAKKGVTFLGKNEKNILIAVNKADAPYLPDNELAFLTNVLSACQLGLSDVAIVNWKNVSERNPDRLFEQIIANKVILFDVEPKTFGLTSDIHEYLVVKHDVRQFVAAPPLSEIEKSKEAKKQLWMALKQLFSI